LIKTDELVLTPVSDRILTPLVLPVDEPLGVPEEKLVPEMTVIERPPAIERQTIETTGGAPAYEFTAPDTEVFSLGDLKPPIAVVTPVAGRDITPVRAPLPVMPSAAMTRGISGSCDVIFDVDTRGRPFNIVAQCTDDLFAKEAARAVSKAEFLPKIRNGVAVQQRSAIYPIEFKMQ
jgi:protein TonB